MRVQVPEYIRTLVPYVPGKPIEETQKEFKLKKVIKLASNENPLGPSLKAQKAIRAQIKGLHRYPDASGLRLKQALSQHLGVGTSQITLGNGSNEVIDQIIRTFCVSGDAILTPQASFIAYRISAQVHGVTPLEVPVDSDFQFDVQNLIEMARKEERVRVVFIANPNNPTGNYLNTNQIRTLLAALSTLRGGSVLLVLDMAYWEYVTAQDLPDATSLLKDNPHLIVLRTFSKVYGLAGLRVGYGIASSELISHLEKVRQPFNLNSLALVAAEAALSDFRFVQKARKVNQAGKVLWEKQLTRMEIPFWKSQGNFLLADVQRGMGLSGREVFQAGLRLGVIFRPVANYGLPHALRISMGTLSENTQALAALKQIIRPVTGSGRLRSS